jgi:hypothetical protein
MEILGMYPKKRILVTNGKELCLTIKEICTQLFNGLLQKLCTKKTKDEESTK